MILAFNERIKPERFLLVMSPTSLYREHRRVGKKMVKMFFEHVFVSLLSLCSSKRFEVKAIKEERR